MKNVWQLQEAKNQLSVVVQNALRHGAQTITKHGKPAVVVLSVEEFRRSKKRTQPLSEFFARSPFRDTQIDLKRIRDFPKDVAL